MSPSPRRWVPPQMIRVTPPLKKNKTNSPLKQIDNSLCVLTPMMTCLSVFLRILKGILCVARIRLMRNTLGSGGTSRRPRTPHICCHTISLWRCPRQSYEWPRHHLNNPHFLQYPGHRWKILWTGRNVTNRSVEDCEPEASVQGRDK